MRELQMKPLTTMREHDDKLKTWEEVVAISVGCFIGFLLAIYICSVTFKP